MGSTRAVLAAAGVVGVLALSGCGSAGEPPAPATATGSLEQLASQVGCAPEIQTDAAEIRQAICAGDGGKFVLTTFAADAGQRQWLDVAEDYGGHYLVGDRWVAVGGTEVIAALRGRLGGTTEEGRSHHPAAGGGEEMAGHPGHHG
jgi:hypothetical protein